MRRGGWIAAAAALALMANSSPAAAFCGFYVGGADAKLFNNASLVVLMREGTRTVLSMQNNYKGPPKNFALVVPVPVVLQKENVKTLPHSVFRRVDRFTAPRLVEYWEVDPCWRPRRRRYAKSRRKAAVEGAAPTGAARDFGVKIEAQFEVGEYQIVILSAKESTGLDRYLRVSGYKIPKGAEPFLRPYVQKGTKFFVAKVDVEKVKFKDGKAVLSPLRFHYDSKEFSLPVRLGLMNSAGKQDLIVHILARGQRYEVANYPNVTIPTNLNVADSVKKRFGSFYAALFDRTMEKNPRAVVTEYSWDASTCDPCPSPPLGYRVLQLLGADVIGRKKPSLDDDILPKGALRRRRRPGRRGRWWRRRFSGGWVVTRLHARYSKDALGDDLVFKAAPPIMGGREVHGPGGELEEGSRPSGRNNFQGRYIIRHLWEGPVRCSNPRWGRWGGPGHRPWYRFGRRRRPRMSAKPAVDLADAPRGDVKLASLVRQDIPAIGFKTANPMPKPRARKAKMGAAEKGTPKTRTAPAPPQEKKRCGGCAFGGSGAGSFSLWMVAALLWFRRRKS